MAKIPGRLLADLHPNGTVRIVFIASVGGGNEAPFTAKNVEAAEIVFMTYALTPGRAAARKLSGGNSSPRLFQPSPTRYPLSGAEEDGAAACDSLMV
jgi:hypothetical protein